MGIQGRIFLPVIFAVVPAFAQADDFNSLMDLSLDQLSEMTVSIATGAPKLLTEAPAGTSVITAADIKAMGAQTLDEALETVPGLYVSRSGLNYSPLYFFRGIVSTYNPQALMLVNGIPMSHLFLGGRGQRMPNQNPLDVDSIERVEIIRGPGSALYGADAFAGVINVITKNADSLSATEASATIGSFSTVRASLNHPFSLGEVDAAVLINYQKSDGDKDAIIESDRQTNVDNLNMAPPASLAPGPAQTQSEQYDLRLDAKWREIQLRASWMHIGDVGAGTGTGDALDFDSRYLYETGTLDVTWNRENALPDTNLTAQLSYLHSYLESNQPVQIFPPGAVFGTFPEGMLGAPTVAEENARFNMTARYEGVEQHSVTIGAGIYWGDIYKTTDQRNYLFIGGVPVYQGEFVDVSDTDDVFQPEAQRVNYHFFVQDEWKINRDVELTAGVRFDDYDDVGSTTNPRLALSWNTTATLTSKILYGEAFRVPTLSELYVQSNPITLGNLDLNPEKLKNWELAFNWQPSSVFSASMNLYHYKITDYIDFVSDGPSSGTFTAQNIGEITGEGVELEARYAISSSLHLLGNYSYQTTEEDISDASLGLAPKDHAYLRLQWGLDTWQVAPQIRYAGDRPRQQFDQRPDLGGYTVFDVSVRHTWQTVSLLFVARNLFDEDVKEPSRGPATALDVANIYYDLPQQSRSLTLELEIVW